MRGLTSRDDREILSCLRMLKTTHAGNRFHARIVCIGMTQEIHAFLVRVGEHALRRAGVKGARGTPAATVSSEVQGEIIMQYRELGRTGWKVSAISFGTWAIGAEWGVVDDRESLAALHRALDDGVDFFDSADVYGDWKA